MTGEKDRRPTHGKSRVELMCAESVRLGRKAEVEQNPSLDQMQAAGNHRLGGPAGRGFGRTGGARAEEHWMLSIQAGDVGSPWKFAAKGRGSCSTE